MDELGSVRGASEFVNVATSVCMVKKIKNSDDLMLQRIKNNECTDRLRGGLKFKIEQIPIKESDREPGSKQTHHGGIKHFNFIDKTEDELTDMCKSINQTTSSGGDSYYMKVKRVLARMHAEGKPMYVRIVRGLILAEGVTDYYITRTLKWEDFGYTTKRTGFKESWILIKKEDNNPKEDKNETYTN